jgi:hypothetical protein
MARGSYRGGSTMIGPANRSWFGKGRTTSRLPINTGKKAGKKARDAAIHRHRQALEIERYAALADMLRAEGFSEAEVERGIQLQRAKDRARRAESAEPNNQGEKKR